MIKNMNYINTPFNFTGSKYKLLEQIIPEFDLSKKIFIDLFTGGGSIYTNVVNLYDKIIINDIINELIEIHKELINNDDIIKKTIQIVPNKDNKESYLKLRESFNENKSPEKLWALMMSCTNNMMRFNKKHMFNQTFGKRTFNQNTKKKIDEFIKHIRPYKNKLYFTSEHFSKIKPKNSMVYIDPPYSNAEAGYNAYWKKNDDNILYEYIKNIENDNSFMISGIYGEHNGKRSKLIDLLIKDGYNYKLLEYNYKKVSRSKNNNNNNEIIIMNY